MKRILKIGMNIHTTNYTLCAMEPIIGEADSVFETIKVTSDYKNILLFIENMKMKLGLNDEYDIQCGYEAGCLGYSLYNQLTAAGVKCVILAPKTMLTPQSVRIKTDMRDAYMITQCLSYGGYHAVYIPTGERKGERMEGSHELVLPNEDLSFRMFLFEGKDGNYVREKHWHRSIEMFVVLEGKLDFYINEEDIHLDKKTFVIVNSNELHSISASLPNKTIVLQMPLQTFERYYTDEQFICFIHRERVQDEQLVELVEKMYATYQEKEIGYELQVQSYFYRLLYLMVTKYRKMNVSEEIVREHRNRNRLSSITGYIKENFKEDLSLEGVAQSFGYSPTYLSRMFRKYAKINYKEYVQGIRLEYAYRELTGSDALVEEIAEHNGFADGRAFAKAFQKKYGVRPSEFRRRQKSEDQKMS